MLTVNYEPFKLPWSTQVIRGRCHCALPESTAMEIVESTPQLGCIQLPITFPTVLLFFNPQLLPSNLQWQRLPSLHPPKQESSGPPCPKPNQVRKKRVSWVPGEGRLDPSWLDFAFLGRPDVQSKGTKPLQINMLGTLDGESGRPKNAKSNHDGSNPPVSALLLESIIFKLLLCCFGALWDPRVSVGSCLEGLSTTIQSWRTCTNLVFFQGLKLLDHPA